MPLILIILGSIFILVSIKWDSKKAKKNKEVNKSFDNILKEKEENMSDYELEIGRLRKDFSETIIELQQDIYSLKEEIHKLKRSKIYCEDQEQKTEKITELKEELVDNKDEDIMGSSNYNEDKIRNAYHLIKKGITDDEICRTLKIGKGELLLIKGLYKK